MIAAGVAVPVAAAAVVVVRQDRRNAGEKRREKAKNGYTWSVWSQKQVHA